MQFCYDRFPYKDSARLVIAGMDLRKRNVHDLPFSNADFIDLREGTKDFFSDMAGVFTGRMVVPREDGTPEQIRYAVATTNFFDVMGGKIVLGRNFTALDGTPQPQAPNNGASANGVSDSTDTSAQHRHSQLRVLSQTLWRQHCGTGPQHDHSWPAGSADCWCSCALVSPILSTRRRY